MSCARFHDAIADHACGAAIGDDAAAHLQSCDACARMQDALRRHLANADAELRLALSLTASPDLANRVAARVQTVPLARSWPRWWAGAAAAAAAVALAAYLVWPGPSGHVGPPTTDSAQRSAAEGPRTTDVGTRTERGRTEAAALPPASAAPLHARRADAPVRSPRAQTRRSGPTADGGHTEALVVIVDARQAQALARLRELVRRGVVLERDTLTKKAETSEEIGIPPLAIPALPVTDIQGVAAPPSTGAEDRR